MFIALSPNQHRAPEEGHVHSRKWNSAYFECHVRTKVSCRHFTHDSSGARCWLGLSAINILLLRSEEVTFARGSKAYRTFRASLRCFYRPGSWLFA